MIGVVLAGGAGSISAAMPSMHSYGFFRFLTGKQRYDKIHKQNLNMGGYQLEFGSISRVINHMTCYKSSALISWNYSIQTGEQIL